MGDDGVQTVAGAALEDDDELLLVYAAAFVHLGIDRAREECRDDGGAYESEGTTAHEAAAGDVAPAVQITAVHVTAPVARVGED